MMRLRYPDIGYATRAAPDEKGTETGDQSLPVALQVGATRAAPYEKGTETCDRCSKAPSPCRPRARPPMRRALKPRRGTCWLIAALRATRAAPYEKGTETWITW